MSDDAVWKLAERRAAVREGRQGGKKGSLPSLPLLLSTATATATSTATAAVGGPRRQCS
jgi:hypothetical protein